MHGTGCPFCEHDNPTASKFCNACGGPLYLAECPHCNALNDATATACYKCEGALPATRTDAFATQLSTAEATVASESAVQAAMSRTELRPDLSSERDRVLLGSHASNRAQSRLVTRIADALSPSAAFAFAGSKWRPVVSKTLPRQRFVVILCGVALAAVAGFGVYAYYNLLAVEVPQTPAASDTVTGADPSAAAAVNQDNAAPAVADEDKNIIQERLGRDGAESAQGAASVPAAMPPQNDDAVTAVGRQPPQLSPCTEGVAALGLCSPQSVQSR